MWMPKLVSWEILVCRRVSNQARYGAIWLAGSRIFMFDKDKLEFVLDAHGLVGLRFTGQLPIEAEKAGQRFMDGKPPPQMVSGRVSRPSRKW